MQQTTPHHFDHPQNIVIGQARVIYDAGGWQVPPGWKLPGGFTTQSREIAHEYAVRMNLLMGGVEVSA